jgi:hypothetical protein
MKATRRLADYSNPNALVQRLRRRRFRLFWNLLQQIPPPRRVLDVGGNPAYWQSMALEYPLSGTQVVLLNLEAWPVSLPGFSSLAGDGRDLGRFADGEFDLVHSNSTIEHVGSWEDQQRMAQEVQRVGRGYFIQTPNRNFPLEPHFLMPLFQFYPQSVQVWLLTHFAVGHSERLPSSQAAAELLAHTRMLTEGQFRALFPQAHLVRERFLGLSKSFVAVGGEYPLPLDGWREKD